MKVIFKNKEDLVTIIISVIGISIILIGILLFIIYIRYKIEAKNSLTKVKVFNIIKNIDGTLLDTMTLNGNSTLKDEDKVDTVMSILYTRKNDSEYISENRIEVDNFKEILLNYFTNIDMDLEETLYYNNEYSKLELYYKPREHVFIDEREMEDFNILNNEYIITIKYSRTLNDKTNSFNTKYILDDEYKIKEATIYNSIMY